MGFLNIDKLHCHKEIQTFLKESVHVIKNALPDTIMIILFGSYARGEANSRSDVDLFILTKEKNDVQIVNNLKWDFLDRNSDLLVWDVEKFMKTDNPLLSQIRNEGILLWTA